MCFLDMIVIAFVIVFLAFTRTLKDGEQGFGRDTTASLRGLAMICILFHHVYNKVGGSSPILGSLGYIVTGLFFFISGYGNTLSLKKVEIKLSWLYKKIIKLYIPFLIAYCIYFITLMLFYQDKRPSASEIFIDVISLSLPNSWSWFPKIILLCFTIHWVTRKLCRKIYVRNILILLLLMAYIFMMRSLGFASWWYNSVLCYPIGCIVAQPSLFDELLGYIKRKKYISFIIFALLFGISFYVTKYVSVLQLLSPIFFSLACFYFSFIYKTKTKFLAWIGNNSFEFLELHFVCLQLFYFVIEKSVYLFTICMFIGSIALLYVYLFVKQRAFSKRNH